MHKHIKIAYFISPHGFGHAARACAVLDALQRLSRDIAYHKVLPELHVEIFSRVPKWFFEESLGADGDFFTYHELLSDIGLAQRTPLDEDIPETLRRLENFLPFDPAQVSRLAEHLRQLGCQWVFCDIAPLGIAVARQAGLPSVLIENFTWDWIYANYLEEFPALAKPIALFAEIFSQANYHIQTPPICDLKTGAVQILQPVSRPPRRARAETRQQLGVPPEAHLVLVTMGGIETLIQMADYPDQAAGLFFVLPGGAPQELREGNRLLLPHHSNYYHPDLVNACDAVVGKAGYSTLAEAYHAGVPFVYTSRPRFRETEALTTFIKTNMSGFEISEAEFQAGSWAGQLKQIIRQNPARPALRVNGALEIADWLAKKLIG